MRFLTLVFLCLLTPGCSLKQLDSKTARVRVSTQPPQTVDLRFQSLLQQGPFYTGSSGISPDAVSGFDCLAVNVVGYDIEDINKNMLPAASVVTGLIGGDSCSYRGITSNTFSTSGGTVELDIPTGPNRLFQVVGVKTPNGVSCPLGVDLDAVDDVNGLTSYFELGRSLLAIGSDTTVSIGNTYSAANPKRLDCGNELYPGNIDGLMTWFSAFDLEDSHANGDPITSWNSKVNFGGQASVANSVAGTNGLSFDRVAPDYLPNVKFSANTDCFSISNSALQNILDSNSGVIGDSMQDTNGFTSISVARIGSVMTDQIIFGQVQIATLAGFYFGINSAQKPVSFFKNSDAGGSTHIGASTFTISPPKFQIIAIRQNSITNPISMRTNGVEAITIGLGNQAGGYIPVSATPTIGCGHASVSTYTGHFEAGNGISEVLLWDRKLSTAEIKKVECYLAQQYWTGLPNGAADLNTMCDF